MPTIPTHHQASNHIQILTENTEGEDFLIGDLHGRCDLLELVISHLNTKDRLFIAGDLVDRGPQSCELIETILKINQDCENKKLPPQIHAARGNHEEIFLNYCEAKRIQKLALDALAEAKQAYEKSLNQLDQEKTRNALNSDKLNPSYHLTLTAFNQLNQSLEIYKTKRTAYDKLKAYLIQLGGLWTTTLDDLKLTTLENYFSSLPYLIQVKSKEPFNVVHADLPFNNQELQTRIQTESLDLSAEERHYIIWARENDPQCPITHKKPGVKEPLTYCGHSIGGGVRADSRHINLDIGSFFSSCVCLVGHNQKTCEILGDTENLNLKLGNNNMTPEKIKNQIREYFNKFAALSS